MMWLQGLWVDVRQGHIQQLEVEAKRLTGPDLPQRQLETLRSLEDK